MLLCKQQSIGQQAGVAAEGAFGAHPGQIGKIIAFREMAEDDICRLPVVLGFKKLSRRLIGEMTNA